MSETGENVVNATVVEALSNLPDKATNSASCCWVICVGEASKLELQLRLRFELCSHSQQRQQQ